MFSWSNEWPGDLARKCIVPGTFLTSTNPDRAHPGVFANLVTPLQPHSKVENADLELHEYALPQSSSSELALVDEHEGDDSSIQGQRCTAY